MSVESHAGHEDKRNEVLEKAPSVQIFLRPIAPPAALGLAGFAGSTWITASHIAMWWGSSESPTIFFPFVAMFGGLCRSLNLLESDDRVLTFEIQALRSLLRVSKGLRHETRW